MQKAVFYHAGCPVCVSAEQDILALIDATKVNVSVVHLGEAKEKVKEAEEAGVRSVPALVLGKSHVLHLNFGASIADLKA